MHSGATPLSLDRRRAESSRWRAVNHELEIDAVVREIDEVFFGEGRLKFPSEHLGIFRSKAEGDHRAHIPEHAMADIWFKLRQVLMAQGKGDAVFAKLRHHVRDGESGELLELVEIDIEGAKRCLGSVGATESRESDRGHQQCPKKRGAVLPE